GPAAPAPGSSAEDDFRRAVEMSPSVSIDSSSRDAEGRYSTGMRSNPPAQGAWFVPGGRIRKNETSARASQRIAREESGVTSPPHAWRPRGVYEHFYDTNFAGEPGRATHYVVLAYEADSTSDTASSPSGQHRRYRWQSPAAIAT
ncbi:hypothetical protein OY671_013064, partial [Metschnikowia pulcherrima]